MSLKIEAIMKEKKERKLFFSLYRNNGKDYYYSHEVGKLDSYNNERKLLEMIKIDFPDLFNEEDLLKNKYIVPLALASNNFTTIQERTDLFQKEKNSIALQGDRLIIIKNYFNFSAIPRSLSIPKEKVYELQNLHSNKIDKLITEMYDKGVLQTIPLSNTVINNLSNLISKYILDNKITEEIDIAKVVNNYSSFNEIIKKERLKYLSISKKDYTEEEDKEERKKEIQEEVVEAYKKFFPNFDEILDWIVACRFTYDRRSSFLHIRANAGFGKSFFKNIFDYVNLVTECRYEDFKSPSSLEAGNFKDKLLLVIDEFTIFKKDFKNITNTMMLDAKFQLRQETEIFAKIFLSAEKSNSFEGGADSQIQDRVNVLDITNDKLEDIFKNSGYSSSIFMENIGLYTYDKIINLFDEYRLMGEADSSLKAQEILRSFHEKYKMKNENLDDVIHDFYISTLFELLGTKYEEANPKEKEILNKLHWDSKGIYIKTPKTTLEKILLLGDENFYKKARYKISSIETIFDEKIKNRKINGKSMLTFFIPKEKVSKLYPDEYNKMFISNS